MRKRNKIIIGVLLVLLVFAFFAFRKEEVAKYTSAKVTRGEVLQTVSATGAVEAKKKIDMKFVNSGQIESINIKIGDEVKEGDILAKLDTSKLESQIAQAKASLQTAQANLRILLEGATFEEIRVYETAVQNAKLALDSAISSAENDVKSAEASVNSAKVTLENAEISLANVEISNENNLNSTYEDAWDTVNSVLIDAQEALNTNDTVLDNDDLDATLSAKNYSYLTASNLSRALAKDSYEEAEDFVLGASSNPSFDEIDDAVDIVMTALVDIRTTLSDSSNVLQATLTSNDLTQTELDSLKSSITLERSSISTSISSLIAAEQAIAAQKVAGQTSLDSAVASVNSASSALAVAQSSLISITASTQNNIAAREGDLEKAENQLEQIKAGPTDAQKLSYQAQVNQAAANVSFIEQQIKDSSITAPYDGTITSVEGEVGEAFSSAEIFTSIIISNGFEIKANISEVDISKIKIGDEVEITFDALGVDRIFKGEISEIDPAETEISGVIYYRVMTIFTADHSVIKPGMTANLDIMTAKKDNVVRIPFQALREKSNGSKYVKIVGKDGEIADVDVVVGLKGDIELEIESGLQEGQEVVTFIEE